MPSVTWVASSFAPSVGDTRFVEPYLRVKRASQKAQAIRDLPDADVIAGLAAAAAAGDPMIANVLATEGQNRIGLYGAIFTTMGEGVIAVGSAGQLTAINPAAEELLGWRADELRGRPIDEVLQCKIPARRGDPPPWAIASDVIAARTTRSRDEVLLARKDGTEFYATYIASPILRDDDVMGAVIVFRDITERRLAEENVRRLAAIVTVSDDAIMSFALDGTILSWNPRAEQIFGARAEEAIGRPATEVLPRQFHADLDALLRRPTNGGGPLQHMARRLERGGEVRHLSITATHVLGEDGVAVAVAWVAEDVTKAALHEEAIRRSEERYRLLLDSVTEHAIFEMDPKGFVTTWNPAAEHIKKWKADEIIGLHYSVLFPPEERQNGDPWTELELAERNGQYTAEVRRLRKDGKVFDASVTLSAMRDPTGQLVGFVKVTRDVSERKEWERRLVTRDEHYRAFFDSLDAPSVWCDPSGQIVEANAAFCAGVGLTEKELYGRGLLSLTDPVHREAANEAISTAKKGERVRVTFVAVGPAGERLKRAWDLLPILRGGVTTGFFAIAALDAAPGE